MTFTEWHERKPTNQPTNLPFLLLDNDPGKSPVNTVEQRYLSEMRLQAQTLTSHTTQELSFPSPAIY